MNDEHTDVLIINKTCETQMSDDEQAGIDPERKLESSEQQKKGGMKELCEGLKGYLLQVL